MIPTCETSRDVWLVLLNRSLRCPSSPQQDRQLLQSVRVWLKQLVNNNSCMSVICLAPEPDGQTSPRATTRHEVDRRSPSLVSRGLVLQRRNATASPWCLVSTDRKSRLCSSFQTFEPACHYHQSTYRPVQMVTGSASQQFPHHMTRFHSRYWRKELQHYFHLHTDWKSWEVHNQIV